MGNERLLLGNERLLLGIIGVFGFFGISFFVRWGGFGLRGSGGPVGVSKISNFLAIFSGDYWKNKIAHLSGFKTLNWEPKMQRKKM